MGGHERRHGRVLSRATALHLQTPSFTTSLRARCCGVPRAARGTVKCASCKENGEGAGGGGRGQRVGIVSRLAPLQFRPSPWRQAQELVAVVFQGLRERQRGRAGCEATAGESRSAGASSRTHWCRLSHLCSSPLSSNFAQALVLVAFALTECREGRRGRQGRRWRQASRGGQRRTARDRHRVGVASHISALEPLSFIIGQSSCAPLCRPHRARRNGEVHRVRGEWRGSGGARVGDNALASSLASLHSVSVLCLHEKHSSWLLLSCPDAERDGKADVFEATNAEVSME